MGAHSLDAHPEFHPVPVHYVIVILDLDRYERYLSLLSGVYPYADVGSHSSVGTRCCGVFACMGGRKYLSRSTVVRRAVGTILADVTELQSIKASKDPKGSWIECMFEVVDLSGYQLLCKLLEKLRMTVFSVEACHDGKASKSRRGGNVQNLTCTRCNKY